MSGNHASSSSSSLQSSRFMKFSNWSSTSSSILSIPCKQSHTFCLLGILRCQATEPLILRLPLFAHFSKEIGDKYLFNSKSPQPCVICKKFTTRPTKRKTHNYHYGFVHRELLNIISDTDPRKEHILKFLN